MAIIPAQEKVFMVSNGTNTTYSGSAALKAMQQWYTMQDVADSVESLTAQDLQEVLTVGNTANIPLKIQVSSPIAINAIEAKSDTGYAIYAESTGEDGVHAISYAKDGLHGTSENGNGAVGQSANGYGVYAYSTNEDGVNATSINKTAVHAYSQNANAMAAYSTAGYGLYAESVNEDGVNTKSNTRHGLNTLSVTGNGVHSVSSLGHAIYAKTTDTNNQYAVIKVETDSYGSNGVDATVYGGYAIRGISNYGNAAYFETLNGGIAMNITSGANAYYNTTIYHNSASGSALYISSYSNGITAYSNTGPGSGYYGIITNTAAKDGGGVWDAYSDSRVKENVSPYTKGLTEILLVNPVSYDYNGLGGIKQSTGHIGVIAQEIKDILPETVGTYLAKLNEDDEDKTELLTFNGTALTYALINAVKELKAEINLLKVEIDLLKSK